MNLSFNILICGNISSGKSTLVNGILQNNLNKMSKIQSTLIPIKYIFNDKHTIHTTDFIRKQNEDTHDKIKELLESNQFTKTYYTELSYNMNYSFVLTKPMNNIINYTYSMTELPGLDDAYLGDYHMEYLENNIINYDVILYLIDIHNCASHSSDYKNIEHIYNLQKNKNLNLKIIVLVNKCDFNKVDNISVIYDEEERETFNEIKKRLDKLIGVRIRYFNTYQFYIYSLLLYNIDLLDEKQIDNIIKEEDGKNALEKISTPELKKKYLKGMITDKNSDFYNKMIKNMYVLQNILNGLQINKLKEVIINYYEHNNMKNNDEELTNLVHIYHYFKYFVYFVKDDKTIKLLEIIKNLIDKYIDDFISFGNIDDYIILFKKYEYNLDMILEKKFIIECGLLYTHFNSKTFDSIWNYFIHNHTKKLNKTLIDKYVSAYKNKCIVNHLLDHVIQYSIFNTISIYKKNNINDIKKIHDIIIDIITSIKVILLSTREFYERYMFKIYFNIKNFDEYEKYLFDKNLTIDSIEIKYVLHEFIKYDYNNLPKEEQYIDNFKIIYELSTDKINKIKEYTK